MQIRLPKTGTSWVTLTGAAALSMLLSSLARAEMVEDHMKQATGLKPSHLFPMNPAAHEIKGTQVGALALRSSKTTTLEQAEGADTISSETVDDHLAFGGLLDLGAGAGLGLSHDTLYRHTETTVGDDMREAKVETMKQQHTQLKLVVELTSELKAGMAIRYLFKDVVLYGSPFLDESETTRYRTTLVGYGGGFAYYFQKAAIGYSYYPPLRGKSEIYGEERIIVEPGEIGVDAYFQASSDWTFGLSGKKWLNELDDRASGTTADDNETNISLYGLDPDQYLFQQRLVMIGADYQMTSEAALKLSVGQEEAEFNFRDLRPYDRIAVRQRDADAAESVTYYRLRSMVSYKNQGIELGLGAGMFSRKHDFPESMNSGSYKSDGKELFATIGTKL